MQLNSSSAIAVDFTDSHRTIRLLQGQVFFQVAHDVGRPFTVVRGRPRLLHSARHSLSLRQ
ncbi:FecR domain-containing protein [Agrobacterium deltaense]|uniref:FecR domain-containing protein n=1 Tax=Agrobacterium deltaense TaxID=1183412 RepID=UPI0030B83E59